MTAERAYHHGRPATGRAHAALDVIATEGPAALSLRDLARRRASPMPRPHHFKDRAGLLTAIAAEGHGLLAAALGEAGRPA